MRTVIFDLDGTLCDTAADMMAAANATFAAAGLPPPLGPGDAATAVRGGKAMLRLGQARLGVPGGEGWVDAAYPGLLRAYGEAVCVHTRPYPGAEAAVERLARAGFALGICTNKPAHLAEALMRALGWRDAFAALVGADTLPVRKPDPRPFLEAARRAGGDPGRAILVGDTRTDYDTARAARRPVALVTFGADGHAVADLAPDALLHGFDDLDAVAARLCDIR